MIEGGAGNSGLRVVSTHYSIRVNPNTPRLTNCVIYVNSNTACLFYRSRHKTLLTHLINKSC